MKMTDMQSMAVNTINTNLCVTAGAGTGKTEVLTRRYINILKNGILDRGNEVENIVAITFTKKATNEMKARVKELLLEEKSDEFLKIYEKIDNSNISTIHSICGKIIRENSYYLDIDPKFNIMDEKEYEKILDEVIVNELGNDLIENSLIKLLMKYTKKFDPDEIVKELRMFYNQSRSKIASFELLKKETMDRLDNIKKVNHIDEILEILRYLNKEITGKTSRVYKFTNDIINKKIIFDDMPWTYEFIHSIELGSNKNYEETLLELKILADETIRSHEADYKDLYNRVLDFFITIDENLKNKKKQLGVLDFNDLEHLTLEILNNETVLQNIQNKFKYIMVDEYQDTNDFQKDIIYKLCSINTQLDRNNLFVVGDPKQSIYGFRGANINVFEDTKLDIENSGGKVIVFEDNFRSKSDIMEPINYIYSYKMKDKYDALTAFNKRDEKENFIYINSEDKDFNIEKEAEVISSYIKKNIQEKDKKPGDYTVLVKSRSKQEIYEKKLEKNKIPYYSLNSTGYFLRPEILDIFNYLELIQDNENELAFLGVMTSPMYGIHKNDIYKLFESNNSITSYKKNNNLSGDLCKQIDDLYNNILKSKEIYRIDGISGLVKYLVEYYNLFEIYNFIKDDYQVQANIYKLIRIAKVYDREGKTLTDFLLDYKTSDEKEGLMQVENEDSDVVKFMTIHGSKGLGFKRTIVPQLNKGNNNIKELFLYHHNHGFAIKISDADVLYNEIRESLKEDGNIERDNVYYVAMTRAKEELVLSSYQRNSGYKKEIDKYLQELINQDKVKSVGGVFEFNEDIDEDAKITNVSENIKDYKYIYDKSNESISFNTLSISMVLEYIKSKESFFDEYYFNYKNFDEIEENEKINLEIPSFLIGNIVHRFAEKYDFNTEKNIVLENVLSEFNVSNKNTDTFKKYIDNYIELNEMSLNNEIYKELEFHYNFEGQIFVGIIDRMEVDYNNNSVKIIDFKLSSLNKQELLKTYKYQLIFYGYVMEKIFTNMDISLELQNIKKNYKIDINFIEEDKLELENYMRKFIYELSNANKY